jgi:hypothetical protein
MYRRASSIFGGASQDYFKDLKLMIRHRNRDKGSYQESNTRLVSGNTITFLRWGRRPTSVTVLPARWWGRDRLDRWFDGFTLSPLARPTSMLCQRRHEFIMGLLVSKRLLLKSYYFRKAIGGFHVPDVIVWRPRF